MKNIAFKPLVFGVMVAAGSFAAQAADTIIGANFTLNSTSTSNTNTSQVTSYTKTFADGLTASFTSAPGYFETKSQDGITGVGISGTNVSNQTSGEIDPGETLTGTFSKGVTVSSIRIGLLFDGPEYKDFEEVAKMTATLWGGGTLTSTFTAKDLHTGIWVGQGSYASVLSGAVSGGTGAWDFFNPFGNALVKSIAFTALNGVCGKTGTVTNVCRDQSDYTFVNMTVSAVPETETYAMMLAGLGLMGTIARRRKARQMA